MAFCLGDKRMKGSAERMGKDVRVQREENVLCSEIFRRGKKCKHPKIATKKEEEDVHEVLYCGNPTFQLQFSLFETRDLGSERFQCYNPAFHCSPVLSLFLKHTKHLCIYIHSNAELTHIYDGDLQTLT